MDQGLNFSERKSNFFPSPDTPKNPWLDVKPRKNNVKFVFMLRAYSFPTSS